jgi:hypothetical protein
VGIGQLSQLVKFLIGPAQAMLGQGYAVKVQLDGLVDQVCRIDEGTVRKDFRVKVKVKRLHGHPLPFPE